VKLMAFNSRKRQLIPRRPACVWFLSVEIGPFIEITSGLNCKKFTPAKPRRLAAELNPLGAPHRPGLQFQRSPCDLPQFLPNLTLAGVDRLRGTAIAA